MMNYNMLPCVWKYFSPFSFSLLREKRKESTKSVKRFHQNNKDKKNHEEIILDKNL